MTARCQPLPVFAIQDFLQDAARHLCARPDETAAQGAARMRRLVHTLMGFQPRDGLEYMLGTLAVGHCDMILDSFRDVEMGQIDTLKARTKSGIVALTRSLRGLLTDLGRAAERPLTEEAQREQDALKAAAARPAETAPAPEPAQYPAPAAEEPAAPAVSPAPSPTAPETPEATQDSPSPEAETAPRVGGGLPTPLPDKAYAAVMALVPPRGTDAAAGPAVFTVPASASPAPTFPAIPRRATVPTPHRGQSVLPSRPRVAAMERAMAAAGD